MIQKIYRVIRAIQLILSTSQRSKLCPRGRQEPFSKVVQQVNEAAVLSVTLPSSAPLDPPAYQSDDSSTPSCTPTHAFL